MARGFYATVISDFNDAAAGAVAHQALLRDKPQFITW